MIKKFSQIFENKQGKNLCNIFIGRFQPFTLGHFSVVEQLYKQNQLPTVILSVKSKTEKNLIFSRKLTLDIINTVIKKYSNKIIDFIEIPNANIGSVVTDYLRPEYEPILLGSDLERGKDYERMINTIRIKKPEINIRDDFQTFALSRGNKNISATKVREALINNNQEEFKTMMVKETHKFYNDLRKELINK